MTTILVLAPAYGEIDCTTRTFGDAPVFGATHQGREALTIAHCSFVMADLNAVVQERLLNTSENRVVVLHNDTEIVVPLSYPTFDLNITGSRWLVWTDAAGRELVRINVAALRNSATAA